MRIWWSSSWKVPDATPKRCQDPTSPASRPKPRWHRRVFVASVLVLSSVSAAMLGWWVVEKNMAAKFGTRVVAAVDEMTRSTGFEVKEVLAVGRQRTKSGDIRNKLENIYGQNTLLVDISTIKKQLETLPWIRSASVRRLLPDTLRLELIEREPMAIWRDPAGDPWLIDELGEVINVSDLQPFAGLPVVTGSGARYTVARLFGQLLEEPDLAQRVSGAELVDERRWNIFLDGRVEVRLPSRHLTEAWSLLARTDRETALLRRAIEIVDLRNPDWLIVRVLEEATSTKRGRSA